jgi:vacuolar-type H+-ATPase subunit C/Vma6
MELIIGKAYTTKELLQKLEISSTLWKKKKNEYLESLSKAYEYEITYKGRAIIYTFTKQIGEYQKPEDRRSKEKTEAIIHQFIRDTIEKDNLQTAANIGRCAFKYQEGKKTSVEELGLKQSTVQEYARVQMKEMFGNKINQGGTDGYMMEKVWCRLDRKNVC